MNTVATEPGAPGREVTARAGFSLIHEPWLPVAFLDGTHGTLSLTEVFRRAHECRSLVGELPTTAFALTRVLLAVLHRVWVTDSGPVDLWAGLWGRPALPHDEIEQYLSEWADRFDLLHPTAPFMQAAGLASAKGEVKKVDVLIADVPNNERHFTTRAGSGLAALSYDEAARWLVHAHAYDPAGIRTGVVGDPRVKGGRSYPIGTGWTGRLGGFLVTGHTLRETLLLNLVLTRGGRGTEAWSDDDRPVWERAPMAAGEEVPGGRPPTGPADVYTWPSRRVRLVHDGTAVTGVVLSNGDPLIPQNRHELEPMTAWRRSTNQERKLGQAVVYMPRTHSPDRALWRGLPALLPEVSHEAQSRDALPPMTVTWLSTLRHRYADGRPALDTGHLVSARATGVEYGSQESTYAEIVDDALALHVDVLTEPELRAVAVDAVRRAEKAVTALGHLARNLAASAGAGDVEGARSRAVEQAYFDLDRPFRGWLRSLTVGADRDERLVTWFAVARPVVASAAEALVDRAGSAAWSGRIVGGRHLTSGLADLWFQRALADALPRPHDPTSPPSPEEEPI